MISETIHVIPLISDSLTIRCDPGNHAHGLALLYPNDEVNYWLHRQSEHFKIAAGTNLCHIVLYNDNDYALFKLTFNITK